MKKNAEHISSVTLLLTTQSKENADLIMLIEWASGSWMILQEKICMSPACLNFDKLNW